jgi:hypothetical protein
VVGQGRIDPYHFRFHQVKLLVSWCLVAALVFQWAQLLLAHTRVHIICVGSDLQTHSAIPNNLTRLTSFESLPIWMHSSSSPGFQLSSSESSLLEEQMQGRRRFFSESATPPRIQRSTELIHRELAIGYVLVPCGSSISSSRQVQLDPSIEVGRLILVADG